MPTDADKLRSRLKKRSILSDSEDREAVVKHVLEKYNEDIRDRSEWAEMRIQRYAKFRGWLGAKDWPWPNAANTHVPVIATDVYRTEDTLHNAVLSSRPVMGAKGRVSQIDDLRAEKVDDLIDFQLFVEQNGEERVGELISSFVQDGTFVAFTPWVTEWRTVSTPHNLGRLTEDDDLRARVRDGLIDVFGDRAIVHPKSDAFEYDVTYTDDTTGEELEAHVEASITPDDTLVLHAQRQVKVTDGPQCLPLELEDVVMPPRAGNLQPPSPANPHGAAHVVVRDIVRFDEVKRLKQQGFYDLLTDADMKQLEEIRHAAPSTGSDPEDKKVQKDIMAGQNLSGSSKPEDQFTRLTYYGRWDVNNDGLEEDVIFWVLEEPKKLCRARYLTEHYPSVPPRRPFAEGRFIPVQNQFYGIGLIELMESLNDLLKAIFDQMIDAGVLTNSPWGLYRAASGVRPEAIRMQPGDLYPTANPKEDIFFPQMPQGMQSFGVNMVTLVGQFLDQLTLVGELQLGRVPPGRSSALRTTSNMQTILQQGDARPERVLRRFFVGLAQVYSLFHSLNKAFLPKGKQFRIHGAQERGVDPYATLDDPSKLPDNLDFEFKANILNTNKALFNQVMQGIAGVLLNGLTFQLGLVDVNKAYNILRDFVKSYGQDPHKYLNQPDPLLSKPRISAAEAVLMITEGRIPEGLPQEVGGFDEHLANLRAFSNSNELGYLSPKQLEMFAAYVQQVTEKRNEAIQQQLFAQLAQQGQQGGGGQTGQAATQPVLSQGAAGNAFVEQGEFLNETLPGAGGGGNTGAA